MPPKKPEIKKDLFAEFGFIVIVLIFLWVLWSSIVSYLKGAGVGGFFQSFASFFRAYMWPMVMVLSLVLTVTAIAFIVRNYRKLKELNEEEKKVYGSKAEESKDDPITNKNERWDHAIGHLNSANASEWRLAIIEADVMLDELLRAQGYHGDSIGEMLKGVEKSDMLTLDHAWEAHKIRNQIVHSGSEYYLTERDAKHAMSLYGEVFREFKVI